MTDDTTKALIQEYRELEQILGKALGYPWYRDDQKNFPGATEADGVCVGEHVPITLAMEAAEKIAELEARAMALEVAAIPFVECYERFLKPMLANEDDDFAMSRWPNGKATLGDYRRLAWLVRDHAGRLDSALEKKPWND